MKMGTKLFLVLLLAMISGTAFAADQQLNPPPVSTLGPGADSAAINSKYQGTGTSAGTANTATQIPTSAQQAGPYSYKNIPGADGTTSQELYDSTGKLMRTTVFDQNSNVLKTTYANNSGARTKAMQELDKICKNSLRLNEKGKLILFQGVIKCFDTIMTGVAVKGITKMSQAIAQTVSTLLVLYVIFIGIKIGTGMTGEQKLKGEVFVAGLKIAFVAWLVLNMGILEMARLVQELYAGMLSMVMTSIKVDGCAVTAAKALDGVWQTLDCLVESAIGWNAKTQNGQHEVPVLFGFISSSLTSGGSFMIGLIVIMAIWNLLMSFFRIAFIYIFSMLSLVILFALGPLMIPMLLFKATSPYFENWWKLIVSMILQPVLMFGFLGFMIIMLNEAIFGPDGLQKIYGDLRITNETYSADSFGTANFITQATKMVKATDGMSFTKEMTFALISVLMMGYILIAFADFVGDMAHELAGTAYAPNLSKMTPKLFGMG